MGRECIVIGGGLAGVLAADSLARRGVAVTMIDEGAAWKASRVTRAMMHPFPSRKLNPDKPGLKRALGRSLWRWRTWAAIAAARDAAGAVAELSMVRPLLEGSPASADMRRTWGANREAIEGLTGEAGVMGRDAIEARFGVRLRPEEAIVYRLGLSLDVPALLEAVGGWLEGAFEVERVRGRVERVTPAAGGRWRVALVGGAALEAERVVLAMGMGMKPWFPELRCHGVGGEVVRLRVARPPGCLISAGGLYVAPDGPEHVVLGATHWREAAWGARSDDGPRAQLKERAEQLWDGVQWLDEGVVWRGMRLMWMPDRMPVVGPLPGRSGVFVLGALSSKGALWGPWAAEALAASLCDGDAPPEVLGIGRVPVAQWSGGLGVLGREG